MAPGALSVRAKQLGQFRNGRVLEENLGRQIYFEEVPDSRDGFNRQQRMSAQVKKVVVNADILDLQQIGPDRSQFLLGFIPRDHEVVRMLGQVMRENGKRFSINLAVCIE